MRSSLASTRIAACFELIGSTTSGVAVFAVGLVLAAHALQISRAVLLGTLGRLTVQNLVVRASWSTGGLIVGEWGESENNRRAEFYKLTAAGHKQLKDETQKWTEMADVISCILDATPETL